MSLMEALGYVGDTIGKPGRAVRGVLAGRPDELANLIPFSDTLGITDPTQQVRGRDLLNQMGVTQADDDGWGSFLGGLGVDVATDPLTYFGGAMMRGALGSLRRPAVGAVPGSEAAEGIFRLDDPIERLMTPEQLAQKEAFQASIGQTSPWAPLADELHMPPAAPDVPPVRPFNELPPPPAEPYGTESIAFDPAFTPRDRGTFLAYGPDYERLADDLGWGADRVGFGHWSSSIPQEMAEDFQKYSALNLNMDKWDEQLAMLNGLHPSDQAALGFGSAVDDMDLDLAGEIAARSPNANSWQRLLSTRNQELEQLRELAVRGALPTEFAPRMDAQRELLERMVSQWENRPYSAQVLYDLRNLGTVKPSEVGELLQPGGPLWHLPINEEALAQMAAGSQNDALLESLTAQLGNFENRYGGLTPSMLEPTYPESANLAQQLRSLLDPGEWVNEGIDPMVSSRLFANPAEHALGYDEMIRNAQDLLPQLEGMAANAADPNVLARMGGEAEQAWRFMHEGIPSPLLRPELLDRGAAIGERVNPDLAVRALGYETAGDFARAFGVRPADFDAMGWRLPDSQRSQLFSILSGFNAPPLPSL